MSTDQFGGTVLDPLQEPAGTTDQFGGVVVDPFQEQQQPPSEPPVPEPSTLEKVDSMIPNLFSEVAAAANRSTSEFIDFLIFDTANALLSLSGSESRSPTLTGALEDTGIQGGFMEPGVARDAARGFGATIPAAAGLKTVSGRNMARTADAIMEFLGFGTQAPVLPGAAQASREAVERMKPGQALVPTTPPLDKYSRLPTGMTRKGTEKKVAREMAVRAGEGDIPAAGFKMGPKGRAIPDAVQKKAIKKGVPEDVVAQVAAAAPADRNRMSEAMEILGKGRKNRTFADFNPPRLVLGDSIKERYDVVKAMNRRAGAAVEDAYQSLKGVEFDAEAYNQGPLKTFFEDLNKLGVKVPREGKIDFSRSVFRGTPNAKKAIKNTVDFLRESVAESAFDVHVLKWTLDEMVGEYGKSAKGMSGKAERIIKDLRHNTNQFVRQYSDEYANANDIYSESIDALNEIERLIGLKNTATASNFARTARKQVSNYTTSDQVIDALDVLDDLATKYGHEMADDTKVQTSFVQTLERLFPAARRPSSLAGEQGKVMEPLKQALQQEHTTTAVDLMARGGKKVFGKSDKKREQELFDALMDLVNEGTTK